MIAAVQLSCSPAGPERVKRESIHYSLPKVVGNIRGDDINESSGLSASKCSPNIFWTHNDSGGEPVVYALDGAGGRMGNWRVPGAENKDWEDIAEFKDNRGRCFLYIGDIGNNGLKRSELTIYRIAEPAVPASVPPAGISSNETAAPERLTFKFPDGPHNSEALLVHPVTGEIYVISKRIDGPASVYRLPSRFDTPSPVVAERLSEIKVPAVPNGQITGGDISPDGTRVVLCDYAGAYEYRLPEGSANFDDIWRQFPEPVDIGDRLVGEAVCYSADGGSIFATSENAGSPFIRVDSLHK
ncbi:MAG: hypothetical protein K1X36_04540 [Pyrinomonadaceae bacterium]|nr:hypothetical protein [Pyrinomonadaceae bacterium]